MNILPGCVIQFSRSTTHWLVIPYLSIFKDVPRRYLSNLTSRDLKWEKYLGILKSQSNYTTCLYGGGEQCVCST